MALVEDSTVTLLSGCTNLLSAPRYELVKVLKQWLLPLLIKYFAGYVADVPLLALLTEAVQPARRSCICFGGLAPVLHGHRLA